MPRGPAGTTEISHPKSSPYPRGKLPFTSRQMIAPAAAFTMACLLFVYARTSIRAAKTNAQRHRDTDSGGEGLSLLAESRRRHGLADKIESGGTVSQLTREALLERKEQVEQRKDKGQSDNDDRLKAVIGKKTGGGGSASD